MAKKTEYRGWPILDFEDNEKYPTRLGCGKLCAVLGNIEAVIEFLNEEGCEEDVQAFNLKMQELTRQEQQA